MTITEYTINIFTDGACSNNPGKGGIGAILLYKEHKKLISGYLPLTTNNQMELLACILALKALKKHSNVNLYTDSTYVKKGITEWIKSWQKNNWLNSNKKPVKNIKLWQLLLELTKQHNISWHWIKGHSGHLENEEVDQLAKKSIINEDPLLEDFIFLSYELGYKLIN